MTKDFNPYGRAVEAAAYLRANVTKVTKPYALLPVHFSPNPG
jgi:hypothetical protein